MAQSSRFQRLDGSPATPTYRKGLAQLSLTETAMLVQQFGSSPLPRDVIIVDGLIEEIGRQVALVETLREKIRKLEAENKGLRLPGRPADEKYWGPG